MGSTSHIKSHQFELSGDYWTTQFIAAHEWAKEDAEAAEAAKKSKEGENKRVVSRKEVSNILDSK